METIDDQGSMFPVAYTDILQRVHRIDPVNYGPTRNYINGAVSYLSPYISRGVISTKLVLSKVLKQGYAPDTIEKFIQELAWRDYWQQLWIAKGAAIDNDLRHQQEPVAHTGIPKAIVEADTGIEAIDTAIQGFYKTGYLHNHVRMYIASICCNIAQSHWKLPAKWMYYHLLDADWASNALSWQWVAGTNAHKKYIANQKNINTYCFTQQSETFLDLPYEAIPGMDIPEVLRETLSLEFETPLPKPRGITIDEHLPLLIYNFYNLDPLWKKGLPTNKVLLLEPSHFAQYPISGKTLDFVLKMAKENLTDIQIYVGEFNDLIASYKPSEVHYKEHPLNGHYRGTETPRDWMFDVKGYYPSFFSFWKKCKKQLSH